MLAPARLILLRHGQTAHNAVRCFQGHRDTSLDEQGHQQAQALAAYLKTLDLGSIALHSSDLRRAVQTAEHLQEALNAPLTLSPALREIRMGEWENRAYADIAAEDPEGSSRFWNGDFHFTLPGGESPAQLYQRAWAYLLAHWPAPGQTLVLVSHGVVVSVLLCALLNLDYAQGWHAEKYFHVNCGYSLFQLGSASGEVVSAELALQVRPELHRGKAGRD